MAIKKAKKVVKVAKVAKSKKSIVVVPAGQVKIRANARTFKVFVVKAGEKGKDVEVKTGMVLANVLDKVGFDSTGLSVSDLDLKVNGRKASLNQLINEHDTIYFASKVRGA